MTDNRKPQPPEGNDLAPLLAESRAIIIANAVARSRPRGLAIRWTLGGVVALALFASGLGIGGAFAAKSPAIPPKVHSIAFNCYRSTTDSQPFVQILAVTGRGQPTAYIQNVNTGALRDATPASLCSEAWGESTELSKLRALTATTQAQYECALKAQETGKALPCPTSIPAPSTPPPSRWVRCGSSIPHTAIVVGVESGTAKQACAAVGLKTH